MLRYFKIKTKTAFNYFGIKFGFNKFAIYIDISFGTKDYLIGIMQIGGR